MNFQDAVKEYFKRYTDFDGRSRRSAFWWVVLFNFIIGSLLNLIDHSLFGTPNMFSSYGNSASITFTNFGIFGGIYSLATLIPSISNSVRRLHDVGKSGWMLLLWLLPLIGWVWLLVLFCTDSEAGDNVYGPNPKTGISQDDLDAIGNN